MTRDELKQIYFINKEIEMWERELEKVRAQSEVQTKKLSGMPFANTNDISDPTSDIAIKLIDIEMIILGKKKELEYKRYEIMKFINNIEDSYMRLIVKYRCVDCLKWEQVADLVGTNAESLRQAFKRFCNAQDEIKG